MAIMQEHYRWLVNLMHDGIMLLAGPAPELFGLVVLDVDDEKRAAEIMDQEPSVVGDVHTYTLHPFTASLLYGRDRLPTQESEAQIAREVTVSARREAVWELWTTNAGLQSFLVSKANVELRVGGKYELHFDPAAPWGSRGSEGCRILTFLEPRLLSFTWNAPPSMPKERFYRTRVVLELEEAGAPAYSVGAEGAPNPESRGGEETLVRLTHTGFGSGEGWPEVVAYFERAWTNVMDTLKRHVEEQTNGQ